MQMTKHFCDIKECKESSDFLSQSDMEKCGWQFLQVITKNREHRVIALCETHAMILKGE